MISVFSRKIKSIGIGEWILNAAIALAAITFVGMLAKRLVKPSVTPPRTYAQPIEVGNRIDIADIAWEKSEHTFLFALSTSCHYCSESAPFYQEVVQKFGGSGHIHLIAVLPQPVADGRAYLQTLGISVNDVRQVDLGSHGFSGTPSLLLIDKSGLVLDMWVGKLGAIMQSVVMERFDNPDGPNSYIESSDLKKEIEETNPPIVVDIDDREIYATAHINGARNIPLDELETRAQNELPSNIKVVVYGHGDSDLLPRRAFGILVDGGFSHVAILRGGFIKWQQTNTKSK